MVSVRRFEVTKNVSVCYPYIAFFARAYINMLKMRFFNHTTINFLQPLSSVA